MKSLADRLPHEDPGLPSWANLLEAPTEIDPDDQRAFARLFNTDLGQRVLGLLRSQTVERVMSDSATGNALFYQEGKRALFAHILSQIKAGEDE